MRVALTTLFLLLYSFSYAQVDSNVCTCTGQALWNEQYDERRWELFDPKLIKGQGIKEATVAVTPQVRGADKLFKQRSEPYTLVKYSFNDSGYVSKVVEYYLGTPSYVSIYVRNASSVVTKKLFSAADTLGDIDRSSFQYFVHDYFYEKGRLSRKTVTEKGVKDKPDHINAREYYEYDDKGRQIKKRYIHKFRFSAAKDTTVEMTKYNVKGDTATNTAYSGRKPYLKTTTVYNAQNLPQRVIMKDLRVERELGGYQYTYDDKGRLQKMVSKNGMGSECPDANNYVNSYFYNATGLPDIIRYEYNDIACMMKVTYK